MTQISIRLLHCLLVEATCQRNKQTALDISDNRFIQTKMLRIELKQPYKYFRIIRPNFSTYFRKIRLDHCIQVNQLFSSKAIVKRILDRSTTESARHSQYHYYFHSFPKL